MIPIGYTDSDFQSDLDFRKSTSGCVFTLGGGVITWRSVKRCGGVRIAQSKDPRNHQKGKHIERKNHIMRDIIARGDVVVAKIESANNLADFFTKALPQKTFESHLEGMGVRLVHNSL